MAEFFFRPALGPVSKAFHEPQKMQGARLQSFSSYYTANTAVFQFPCGKAGSAE
jgi:hypothetical protein